MKVTQLKDIINSVTTEILGKDDVLNEDLTNITDIGKEIIDTDNIDNYVKKLVNHIGSVLFVNRLYNGSVPSVLMDSWEFGSILEKITADLPEADENASWNLQDGQSYDQDVFYQPKVEAKFYNSKVTFDIPLSFTEEQVKESFDNVNQLNGFVSMLQTSVQNSMTVKLDALIMRTINNMTAQTLNASADKQVSTVTAVNLLADYNAMVSANGVSKAVSAKDALQSPEFIKFASMRIALYQDRMSKMSTLFNLGGKERFTPSDNLHLVLLSDFAKASDIYLESNTYHNDLVALPNYETVPYWQGSGKSYSFDDISKIDVKTEGKDTKPATVTQSGILGVMFDTNALGVSNLNQRVTTNYNARAEFFTNWYKFDAGYYNDLNENYVVFFIQDEPANTTTTPSTGGSK